MNETTLKQAKILMVDDEVSNTCLLTNILNRFGYSEIKSINEPTLLFDAIETFQPDLLLLDLMMPNLTGFQILEELKRQIPAEQSFPVLVLSGNVTTAGKRKALSAGATDLLAKPFDPSEIIMRIRNLLQTRFLRKEIERQNQGLEERVAERTRQLEEALAELKATQEHMLEQARLRAFAEMAGGVVHDFSNALMSVIGYSEILIHDPAMLENDKEVVLDYLRVMNTAGRDAAQVVNRLRDFYRPRDGGDCFESVDINEVAEQVVPLTQPKWRDHALSTGRAISIELELEKVPPINGNSSELREILTNLIFNAVDAIPENGTITLRTRRETEHVILEVVDTGCGMSPEVRAHCLEPFFSTKGDKGTGLGLSMVFGTIKRHDAVLNIESEAGKGSTFQIRFPSLVPTLSPEPVKPAALHRQLNILVVDDEEVSRNVISRYLISDGHRVATASNGHEAVDVAEAERFDVVLTDLGMPGMSGAQLAPLLKRNGSQKPVILFTGTSDPGVLPPGSNPPGVDLIIHKPIPHSKLIRALATVLEEKAHRTRVLWGF